LLVVLFGAYLPLFGASLVLVLLAEFAVLKRIPRVRDWLGLHVPRLEIAVLLVLTASLSGCGGVKPVTGGTPGLLHSGSTLLSDTQVTVHKIEGGVSTSIGFGVAGPDGSFELVTNEAKGPLRLAPGQYRYTLESVGTAVVIPKEYTSADTTPLVLPWSADDSRIDLDIPVLQVIDRQAR
jgi:hypothetical protein